MLAFAQRGSCRPLRRNGFPVASPLRSHLSPWLLAIPKPPAPPPTGGRLRNSFGWHGQTHPLRAPARTPCHSRVVEGSGKTPTVGDWGRQSMVKYGPWKSTIGVEHSVMTTGCQCVNAATSQHVGSTASTLGWMCQSCAAAPLTVWPAFLHHGCCGPYSSVDGRSQRLLRVHLSEIFLGQVPPGAPRPSSLTRP